MFPLVTLLQIARAGGNLKIDASKYPPVSLIQLARVVANSNSQSMTLKNCSAHAPVTLLQIARAGDGKIIFDIDI